MLHAQFRAMYSTPWMSDIVVGIMRWGIWDAKFTTAQYEAMIDKAMSLGMSTFDHADIYGNHTTEAEFGAALKLHPEWRSQIELVTKCGILHVAIRSPRTTPKLMTSPRRTFCKVRRTVFETYRPTTLT